VADYLRSIADSTLGISLIESTKFLAPLTGSGAIFGGSDASAAHKIQGSDDRKWRLPNPQRTTQKSEESKASMAVVSCVTPMSMFQLPTDIRVAILDLLLG
jgi:hypothetical protein